MLIRSLLLPLLCLQSWSRTAAFVPTPAFRPVPSLLFSTTDESTTEIPLVIEGKNLELTEALMSHIQKRIGGPINKLSSHGSVRECDVTLSVSKNPKIKDGHHVEIVTNLKGTTIICTHASPDMYNSIDQAAHALQRKLRQYKERRQDGWHGGAAMGDDLLAALESFEAMEEEEESTAAAAAVVVEDDFVDPDAPTVIKVNSFALDKAISVQEAVFALDYVDHDFYVFRNEETDKITVVYKRKIGGVGLIEP